MTAELHADGSVVNHKRVERVMRENGIVGVHLRKTVRTTVPDPDAAAVPDLIQRNFTANAPNTRYVGDITYLPIGDGDFFYLATVLDLHSKRLAGWSIADHMRTGLVTDALRAAAAVRGASGLDGAYFTATTEPSMRQRNSPTYAANWASPGHGRDRNVGGQRRGGVLQCQPESGDAAGQHRPRRRSDGRDPGARRFGLWHPRKIVHAALRAGARFSVVMTRNPAITRAIAGIDEGAWTTVKYPGAVRDPDNGEWISDAEVAESPTANTPS